MSGQGLPQISVLMPFRDALTTLEACICSVQAQNFEDFELLCVDDGSDDDGPRLLRAMATRDPRIRLLGRPRIGLVSALNFGLRHARAPYLARMDADDLMHPQRLARQHAVLHSRHDLSVVASCVDAFSDTALRAGMREYLNWQDRCISAQQIDQQIYVESPLVHPSVMFRGDVVRRSGGYRYGPFPEDYELWLRLCRLGYAMEKLPQRLLRWRQHDASLTRQDPRYARTAFDELRACYLATDPRLCSNRALVIWGAGRRTRRRAERLIAKGHPPAAYVDIDPRKIGNRLSGVPVQPPSWLARQSTRPFVLGYVASHGARDAIATALREMEYREGEDFLMVG